MEKRHNDQYQYNVSRPLHQWRIFAYPGQQHARSDIQYLAL